MTVAVAAAALVVARPGPPSVACEYCRDVLDRVRPMNFAGAAGSRSTVCGSLSNSVNTLLLV